jgi:LAO/AO transport system kinase
MADFNLDRLLSGDRRALAKAITLVESKLGDHREQAQSILEEVLPHTGNSVRIGITGVPGVGKSTFIEAFGLHLIEQGKRGRRLSVRRRRRGPWEGSRRRPGKACCCAKLQATT